jgi:hypothetical protein
VGKPSHASPRASGGGARQAVGQPHGGWGLEVRRRGLLIPRRPRRLERSSGGPEAGAGAGRRAIPPLCRRSRGAAAVGGAARPQRFAQPSTERGAADPQWPCVACLSGAFASSGQIAALFIDLVVFVFVSSVWHSWVSSAMAGVGAPRPRQVRRPRPDERRAPPSSGSSATLSTLSRRP